MAGVFTGIITDIGRITKVERVETKGEGASQSSWGDTRMEVACAYDTSSIALGASIAHAGACMTVVETWPGGYAFEVSDESLSKTTMGDWRAGTSINLERALTAADELGGHLVTGHVDGTGRLEGREEVAGSLRLTFSMPDVMLPGVAPKGSVVVDGVSLTVNDVSGDRFTVNIIPHTAEHTTLGALAVGDAVNLEMDLIARYVARTLEHMGVVRDDT